MPVLSDTFRAYAEERLAARADLLAPIADEIRAGLDAIDSADERALVASYYGTLPLTDVFDTPFEVLASFAAQARELRETSPWCRDVPEDVFIHFVACPRVNNEPLTDAWPTFRAALAERLAGRTAPDAILETNYWCAEMATYQASDGRTLGPLGVLASGDGRCGEESTFLVCALRANGIPARQIYTPWWAHCDDNHAWVEAYADGDWHYLGACEPEEALDRGWFTAASGRAMLVHTRLFSDFGCDFDRDRHLLAREGSQVIVNLTASYAPVRLLTVRVVDAAGAPAAGASVRLRIVNEAAWHDIAQLTCDADGCAQILVGEGTLRVVAVAPGALASRMIDTSRCDAVEIALAGLDAGSPAWEEFDVHAPADHPAPSGALTPEMAARGRARKREADRMRTERIAAVVDAARELSHTSGFDTDECLPFFEHAFSNAGEVARFLGADGGSDRAELLGTLTTKDFRDLSADVLEDHIAGARLVHDDAIAYLAREGVADADAAEDLYVRYVLSPRAHLEHLAPYRAFIRSFFDADAAARFVADPALVWSEVCAPMGLTPAEHVKKLSGSPRGALLSGEAGTVTRRALFVAICRTFGIPARINPLDAGAEYFARGGFVPLERAEGTVEVTFTSDAEHAPGYFQSWSVARLADSVTVSGDAIRDFEELDLWGKVPFADGTCTVGLPLGDYRLTTAVRLPSGDIQAAERAFAVGPEGCTSGPIALLLREPDVSQMLSSIELAPFTLDDGAGGAVDPGAIAAARTSANGSHPVVIAFLEPGMEPTEHLLNEMREHADRIRAMQAPIVLALPDAGALADPTLSRTLPALTDVTVAFDDFSELPERLARRMFTNPEKLPLSILAVADGDGNLTGRYAIGGYNVGTVDLMLKLMTL